MCRKREFSCPVTGVRLQGIGGLPMNMNRPDMTENVKYKDYTNESLQMDSTTTTMEVVTQTNAVNSPTDSPKTRSWCTRWKRSHECWPSACALLTTCATAPPSSVSCGRRKHPCAEGQFRCVVLSGSLIRGKQYAYITNAATLTASATPTKMSTARAATNGKVFPPRGGNEPKEANRTRAGAGTFLIPSSVTGQSS